jgi:hypothetical protein
VLRPVLLDELCTVDGRGHAAVETHMLGACAGHDQPELLQCRPGIVASCSASATKRQTVAAAGFARAAPVFLRENRGERPGPSFQVGSPSMPYILRDRAGSSSPVWRLESLEAVPPLLIDLNGTAARDFLDRRGSGNDGASDQKQDGCADSNVIAMASDVPRRAPT